MVRVRKELKRGELFGRYVKDRSLSVLESPCKRFEAECPGGAGEEGWEGVNRKDRNFF